MSFKGLVLMILVTGIISCNLGKKDAAIAGIYEDVKVVGAMKNVMWNGELGSRIDLDTISNKKGLYGLGPESFLTGEILIYEGKSYVSKVISDSTISVRKTFDVSAPFFVYANINQWQEIKLPEGMKTLQDLEKFINSKTADYKRPFAFKLKGKVSNAIIHIQNLPKGTKVSSPDEAHQGQVKYELQDETVNIVGFFSTEHKGIFTHHDSFLHMHLISEDESKMGHLDGLEMYKMKLYIPVK